jgi:hypothetical protein
LRLEVQVNVRVVRIEGESTLKLLERTLGSSSVMQRQPQQHVGKGEVRIEGNRFFELARCLIVPAAPQMNTAQSPVAMGVPFIQCGRPLRYLEGLA